MPQIILLLWSVHLVNIDTVTRSSTCSPQLNIYTGQLTDKFMFVLQAYASYYFMQPYIPVHSNGYRHFMIVQEPTKWEVIIIVFK